jgi:predicted GNAT family acetyltransferase
MYEVLDLLQEDLAAAEVREAPAAAGTSAAEGGGASRSLTVAEALERELAELGGGSGGGGGGGGSGGGGGGGGGAADGAAVAASLRSRLETARARFMDLGTRALGLVWVTQRGVDVVAWADGVLARAAASKQAPLRFTARVLPAQRIVPADAESVGAAVGELWAAAFPAGSRETTYKVELRARNCAKLEKGAALRACTAAVGGRHLVLMDDPATIVLVEAVKHVACVAVLKGANWRAFSRYNVRLAAETEEEAASRVRRAQAELERGRGRKREAEAGGGGGGGGGDGGGGGGEGGAGEGGGEGGAKRARAEEAPPTHPPQQEPPVTHDDAGRRFSTADGAATLEYSGDAADGSLAINHVQTKVEARGRGLAAALVAAAVAHVAAAGGRRLKAVCSYAADTWAPRHAAAAGWSWEPPWLTRE